ncbi:unnamed protein product [Dovyalis caffra]|uniref:BHLH domain-containing protein n=1 Tax=Dovyalis caffra TaxID=77055 RepID=A0AAV1S5N1_9ROSI|nr:unnamed protein product [Dovyalis caffra]
MNEKAKAPIASKASFMFSLPCQPNPRSMETVENMAEYQNYWEMTKMFWNDELINSWATNQASTKSYDSSSPDGAASIRATKNIDSERKRRKKLNDKLLALREAVPKISKLDKASIVKDAIEYIQDLQEQERRLQAEIMELESEKLKKDPGYEFEQELPFKVTSMGEKILLVSLTCSEARDAMIKICEVFESLKLKIITANATVVSGMIMKTVLIEADVEERDNLKMKIERAISALSGPYNHTSM